MRGGPDCREAEHFLKAHIFSHAHHAGDDDGDSDSDGNDVDDGDDGDAFFAMPV